MYKIVKLKYKSIMINDDDKNSVEIKTNGTIHQKEERTHIYFESKEKIPFEICFEESLLTLKQGKSILELEMGKRIENAYETPYGALSLVTHLDVLDVKEDCIKIKYRLFQQEDCISQVYMQINWLVVES